VEFRSEISTVQAPAVDAYPTEVAGGLIGLEVRAVVAVVVTATEFIILKWIRFGGWLPGCLSGDFFAV